jgi:hypothetical protein
MTFKQRRGLQSMFRGNKDKSQPNYGNGKGIKI